MTSVESDSFDDTVGSEDSVGTLGLGVSEYVLESETDDNQSGGALLQGWPSVANFQLDGL